MPEKSKNILKFFDDNFFASSTPKSKTFSKKFPFFTPKSETNIGLSNSNKNDVHLSEGYELKYIRCKLATKANKENNVDQFSRTGLVVSAYSNTCIKIPRPAGAQHFLRRSLAKGRSWKFNQETRSYSTQSSYEQLRAKCREHHESNSSVKKFSSDMENSLLKKNISIPGEKNRHEVKRSLFVAINSSTPSSSGPINAYYPPLFTPEGGNELSMKSPNKPKFFKASKKEFAHSVLKKILKITPSGVLFEQPLEKICDPSGQPPKPIKDLLLKLWNCGPQTCGIFRKSASARLVKDWREKLDSGKNEIDFDELNIHAAAALLKEFLRSLPDCLLCSSLYEDWIGMTKMATDHEKLNVAQGLLSHVSSSGIVLLKLVICILKNICDNSEDNKMTYFNMSVCIGPSILWPLKTNGLEFDPDIFPAISYLIENCDKIFGKDIRSLLHHLDFFHSSSVSAFGGGDDSDTCKVSREICYGMRAEQITASCTITGESFPRIYPGSYLSSSASLGSQDSGINDEDIRIHNIHNADDDAAHDSESDIDQDDDDTNENAVNFIKKRRQYNYSRKNYFQRYYYQSSPRSRFRRNEWMKRQSASRKRPKNISEKTLIRAASEESILSKYVESEKDMDFLDRQLLRKEGESNLTFKNKLSSTNVSKDSGITLDESPTLFSDDEDSNMRTALDYYSPAKRNSLSKIRPVDEVDYGLKLTRATKANVENSIIYTDEPLCPLSTAGTSADYHSEEVSSLIASSIFQRKSWTRQRSKKKKSVKS